MVTWALAVMVQIDVETLHQQHEHRLKVEERLDDLLRGAGPTERELAGDLRAPSSLGGGEGWVRG